MASGPGLGTPQGIYSRRSVLKTVARMTNAARNANPDTFLTTVAYPIKGTPYYNAVADRVIRPGPWSQYTDRDLSVAARQSKRFYSFATRWMVSEVRLHKLAHARPKSIASLAKALELGKPTQ